MSFWRINGICMNVQNVSHNISLSKNDEHILTRLAERVNQSEVVLIEAEKWGPC